MSHFEREKETGRICVQPKFPDLRYGVYPLQTLDLYIPEIGKAPFPTVVFIHGGGWTQGDKRDDAAVRPLAILKAGYAVASLNYRLAPNVTWKEQLSDVRKAVRTLRKVGAEYGLQTDKLVVWGSSAGGHLAQLLTTMGGRDFLTDIEPNAEGSTSAVQGIISMYGVSEPIELDNDEERLTGKPSVMHCDNMGCAPCQMAGFVIRENPEQGKELGSIGRVTEDFPPILLQHGTGDTLVPWYQSERLHKKVLAVCGEGHSILELFEGADHGDAVFFEEKNIERIVRFLNAIFVQKR